MSIHNLNFEADLRPLFDVNGAQVDPALGRAVHRNDTDQMMAIAGPNFVPLQHKDIVDPILQTLEQGGYDIEERSNASRGQLYDIAGKKAAFIDSQLTLGGAVLRVDIILGDFIEVTGGKGTYGLARGEDTNLFKVSVRNSHNSMYAAGINSSYHRIKCLNGMTQAHNQSGLSIYGKHTASFNLDGMQAKLGNAFEAMSQDAEKFNLWANTMIDVKDAEAMLKKTIAKLSNKPNGDPHWSQATVDKILLNFRREGGKSIWDLYNGVTEFQTHNPFKTNSNRMTVLMGREQKVASMLNSNPWKEFVSEAA